LSRLAEMRSSRRWQAGIVVLAIAVAVLAATSARAGTPGPTYFLGDVNCDERIDSIDAALLLQREAALLQELSCGGNADMDGDNLSNSVDAGLVLQYTAGLIFSRVQFALNVTRPEGLCDDEEKPSVCNVPTATEFGLSIALNRPPPEGYIVIQTTLVYGDLHYNPTTQVDDEIVWPESRSPLRALPTSGQPSGDEGAVSHGSLGGVTPPINASHHQGELIRLSMACPTSTGSFTIALLPYDPERLPIGSLVNLAVPPPSTTVASTVTVGEEDLNFDSNGNGTIEPYEITWDVAARLRVNCVE